MLPLFLFAAGHVKNDLPLALAEARRAFPATRFSAARALGVDPGLVDLAYARVPSPTWRKVRSRKAPISRRTRGMVAPWAQNTVNRSCGSRRAADGRRARSRSSSGAGWFPAAPLSDV